MSSFTWAKDVESLWHGINRALTAEDAIHNMFRGDHYLNKFGIMAQADSHYCNNLTLEKLAYTPKKARHLLGAYLDPKELRKWLLKLEETTKAYGQVDSDILIQTIRESKHGNGPCLLGFGFRSRGGPHLTIFSRSAELPQLFGADCLLVSALGHIISERLGLKEPIKITWFLSSIRIKSRMANLYRIYCHPEPVAYKHSGFQDHIDKGWDKFLVNKHPVTFTKLVRLQELYDNKMNDSYESRTGATEFARMIESYMGGIT